MNEDILFNIAVNLPIKDVISLCKSNKEYNQLLCNNQRFWKLKYYKDFGPVSIKIDDWKEAYIHFGDTYGIGLNVIHYKKQQTNNVVYDNLTPIMVPSKEYAWYQFISNYYNVQIPLKTKKITCGHLHTLVIDIYDGLWTFGSNRMHQLGVKYYEDKPIRLNRKAFDIASGGYHNLFIDFDYNLYGFGSDTYGQLGQNNIDSMLTSTIYNLHKKAKKIACGENHSLFIDLNDYVWVMGYNHYGQLGLGDDVNRYVPTKLGMKAKDIAAGNLHSILIGLDNNIYVFGNNKEGQLGLGDYDNRYIPTQLPTHFIKSLYCDELSKNFITKSLYYNESSTHFIPKSVSCGGIFTTIIDANDHLWMFGYNSFSKSNIPIIVASDVSYVVCGEGHGLYVTLDGIGHGFGHNEYHQTEIPTDVRIHHAGCGSFHTVLATY